MWLTVFYAIGNIASILTFPSLVVGYTQLSKKIRALHAPKGVSEDTVEFLEGRVAINLVPITKLHFLPRKGDKIMLPSEPGELDAGAYEVLDVCHIYTEDTEEKGPCPARLLKVSIVVKKMGI